MVEMPKIKQCEATDCSYNRDRMCHAAAITVGANHPYCDTYNKSAGKGGINELGEVGACRVENCTFNKNLECSANSINVGLHDGHPDCFTFKPKL
jgi:hypothetical protein